MTLKNMVLATAMLLALPVSAAAATSTPDTTYATLHASEPPIAAGMGRIYLYREDSWEGMAIQPTIMIDGQSAGGRAKPGDYFYVDRPAGTHEISTETEKTESTTVTVTAGQAVYVKFEISMGFFMGHVSPVVVANEQGMSDIKDCDWHEPKPADGAPVPASASPAPANASPAPISTSSAPVSASPASASVSPSATTTTPASSSTPAAP